ncbi:MAG: S8 family serine peptidase [Bryobacterales bacterium]|nr:S8 family serine peptidase [Bryobacterales bacterium]
MTYSRLLQRLGLLLMLLMPFVQTVRADDDDDFVLRVLPANLNAVVNRYGLEVEESFPAQNLYLVEREDDDSDESTAQFVARVRRDTRVLGFEINQDIESPEVTNPVPLPVGPGPAQQALSNRTTQSFYGSTVLSGYVQQPAASLVRLPQVRQLATGGGIVAIIDTGVDPNHPLLRGALLPGYDFLMNVADASEWVDVDSTTSAILGQEAALFLESLRATPLNPYATAILSQEAALFLEGKQMPAAFGHGTMVAGVVRLVAPTARILPLRAFSGTGASNLFDVMRAIYFAADRGAKVINMSFTIEQPSDEFTRAINYASGRGSICVGAAGNAGRQTVVFPAGYHNVLGVASTTSTDTRSAFSNFGAALVSLAAPGEGIITSYPGGGYVSVWGTSFSTPLVAGAIALMEQIRPGTTYSQAERSLQQARPLGPELGAGRLDVFNAVSARMTLQ